MDFCTLWYPRPRLQYAVGSPRVLFETCTKLEIIVDHKKSATRHLSLELNFSCVDAMNLVSGISGHTICSNELSVRRNLQLLVGRSSELPPCRQIHLQRLAPIGEDMEGNLGSLLLQVRNELLQQGDPVNLYFCYQGFWLKARDYQNLGWNRKSTSASHLAANGRHLALVHQQIAQSDWVLGRKKAKINETQKLKSNLYDKCSDGEEGQK